MEFTSLDIPDVILLTPKVFGDERGFFMEVWRESVVEKFMPGLRFVQENHSRSQQNVLRGLHYQIEQAQGKLVRAVLGQIFDVAVDLRRQSETFGRWTGIVLSDTNKQCLWIPPGFAHGFLVQSEFAEVMYTCTDYYAQEHERIIRWDDPDLAIEWPMNGIEPLVSEKDAAGSFFKDADVFMNCKL